MTLDEDALKEASSRLVDDREYMVIDAPDEVDPEPEEDDENS